MIVTVISCAAPGAGTLVARNLAVLRARAVRKVLLLDASPGQDCLRWGDERARARLRPALAVQALRGPGRGAQVERLLEEFCEIVIGSDGCGDRECRWALIAAQVAVVPLARGAANVASDDACIAKLNEARMFNPGLRVVPTALGNEPDPPVAAMAMLYRDVYGAFPRKVASRRGQQDFNESAAPRQPGF